MNPPELPSRSLSPHLPIALLALSFFMYLLAQYNSVHGQKEVLQFQIQNAKTQEDNLVKAEKQLKELSVQRESLVKQSAQIQNKFQSILNDLLELAKDDKDAREVVETWKIQRNPAPAPASGTP